METISMNRRERTRLVVFSRVAAGELSLKKASELLDLSYRQTKRLARRYAAEGDSGLVHRLRGRKSNRQSVEGRKAQALALYQEKYSDHGPTLAAEYLAQEEGLEVPVTTLHRWLVASGLWTRQRQAKAHRRRRPRKEHRGELVQMDGSHHDWFEGRRGEAVLMVMIDDATSASYARFFEEETLSAALETFREYVRGRGMPRGLYVDRHGIYRSDREPTEEELLANRQPQTQFGRAMETLGVKLTLAHSPQAKGRVERVNRTLQDRLVKALRRAKISDLASANDFLEQGFLSDFAAKFSVPALREADLHMPLPAELDLDRVLAVWEERVVQNDWTIRWHNHFLQLPRRTAGQVQPGARVVVCEQLDGKLRLFCGEEELAWSATQSEPRPAAAKRRKSSGPTGSSQGQKPAANHPWRRSS